MISGPSPGRLAFVLRVPDMVYRHACGIGVSTIHCCSGWFFEGTNGSEWRLGMPICNRFDFVARAMTPFTAQGGTPLCSEVSRSDSHFAAFIVVLKKLKPDLIVALSYHHFRRYWLRAQLFIHTTYILAVRQTYRPRARTKKLNQHVATFFCLFQIFLTTTNRRHHRSRYDSLLLHI